MSFLFRTLLVLFVSALNPSFAGCPGSVSGAGTTTVIELYTSEGCDSCPPADKWFSTLGYRKDGVVPLAFHVDYWDYIGWKDRFAQAGFAERQRSTVSRHGGRTVYTPQVMLDGHDARGLSFGAALPDKVRAVAQKLARARLQLQSLVTGETLEISVRADVPDAILRRDSSLFIAVTEDNLLSRVTAGENRGVELRHDHVVRTLIGPVALHTDGNLDIQRRISLPRDWKRADLQVAAFVQSGQNGEILQALAAPACPTS
ncbi:MAG: DUF1223 domain-containing protein [Betaproteobacteria bacterium]|nr:DUF1223 domain-containing protein [Betaproteobacteria bacterium]